MDSTEIPVDGEQEQSAYNGHFESRCYHPLLVFHREGDSLAAKLRPGHVHSAEGGEELRLPEIAYNLEVAACRSAVAGRQVVVDEPPAAVGEEGGRLMKHARYYWLLLAEVN